MCSAVENQEASKHTRPINSGEKLISKGLYSGFVDRHFRRGCRLPIRNSALGELVKVAEIEEPQLLFLSVAI